MKPLLSPARQDRLDWLLQLAATTGRLFAKNELLNHAAAVSLYFLLSAAPLVLLLLYATRFVEHWAEGSVAGTILLAAIHEQFHLDSLRGLGLLPAKVRLTASGLGILALLVSSRGLVNALQSAFRVIFPAEVQRRFVVSWLAPLLIVPLAFLVIILSIAAREVVEFMAQPSLLGAWRADILRIASQLISLLIAWLLVFFAYWRLPVNRPPLRQTLIVSILATLSIYGLAWAFGHFVEAKQYHALYGALGGVVFVLIGVYFIAVVFFAWAQCLQALMQVDVAALASMFPSTGLKNRNRLESLIFSRRHRLLEKYGQTLPAGSVLIREGETGDTSYYLHMGRVALYKGGTGGTRLGQIEQGELFGEMAYLLNEPRTATVVAETEVTVLALPPKILEDLMRHSAPLSRRIIAGLCQRLKAMNQALNS